MNFKDHFSGHASAYREARPTYDPALFAWLAGLTTGHERAWDVGCGNGQASVALAAHYAEVVATDPSAPQIANAERHPRIAYRVEPAERSTLADDSVDLVTVAQALHWFDPDRFHAEVRRVLRPGGVIAAWSYAHCRIAPAFDPIVACYYDDVVGPYWPAERRHVENGYAELSFPYAPIEAPAFDLVACWDLPRFLAYLRSWSATQRCLQAQGSDPLAPLEPELAAVWGDPETVREVRWNLSLRVGRRD